MGLAGKGACRKCGQDEEFSCHTLCQRSTLAGHGIEIFSSAWLETIDVRRA
jgi:hypothetical protein